MSNGALQSKQPTYFDEAARKGYSRRDFMKFVTMMSAFMRLEKTMVGQVAKALENHPRATSNWWLPKLFAWVPAVLGGDIATRQIHHWTMWIFILFTIIHVYLVFYHDYVEGRGEISSMGGGWKFIEEDLFEQEHKHTPNPHK